MPAGSQLEVELTLSALHQVSSPAPGVSMKLLASPEGSYMKPNDGASVTLSVATTSLDGAVTYEAAREVTFTTDEEQVRRGVCVWWRGGGGGQGM